MAGALLIAVAVGLLLRTPSQRSRPQEASSGALQPVGGEQKKTSKIPETSTTASGHSTKTRSNVQSPSPKPVGTPEVPMFFEVQGAPRVTEIRCIYVISSHGGSCRYHLKIVNDTNATLSSMQVELRVAPENKPEDQRVFEAVTTRYHSYEPRETAELYVDVPSMEIGFYHVRACVLGYRWLHPADGWQETSELSCEGGLLYAGPG